MLIKKPPIGQVIRQTSKYKAHAASSRSRHLLLSAHLLQPYMPHISNPVIRAWLTSQFFPTYPTTPVAMKVASFIAAFWLLQGSVVLGHEDMDMEPPAQASNEDVSSLPAMASMTPSPASMHSSHHHGRLILNNPDLEPQQRAYWEKYDVTNYFNSDEGSKPLLYAHAILAFFAFALLYPMSVLISTDPACQWLYLPLQTVTTVLGLTSLLLLTFYSAGAPSLYPGSIYGGLSFVMFVVLVAHWSALAIKSIARYLGVMGPADGGDYLLANMQRPSSDSGHQVSDDGLDDLDVEDPEAHGIQRPRISPLVSKMARNTLLHRVASSFGALATLIFKLTNIPLFFLGFVYLFVGLVVGECMGKGHMIFGLLAHLIKGFVFFILGFLELARYCGLFAQHGMAWNRRPEDVYPSKSQHAHSEPASGFMSRFKFWPSKPTMEYIQSLCIFIYGATNVFLEHLGNEDGVWSHKDIQHASIAFMFIGGGLSGLVLESEAIRKCIATGFGIDVEPRSYYFFNPMPAFTVFWTGALMSRHEQETPLSTEIHIQWGSLLSLAAVFRLSTYLMLFLRPMPDDAQPQKPFTELLTSFCLVCGGMIFMASNRETVEAMIYRGIDSMFTLNVSVGISAMLISFAVFVFAIRGIALRRGQAAAAY